MKLKDIKLCLNTTCEEVFTDKFCPSCGSSYWIYLAKWIPTFNIVHQQILTFDTQKLNLITTLPKQ